MLDLQRVLKPVVSDYRDLQSLRLLHGRRIPLEVASAADEVGYSGLDTGTVEFAAIVVDPAFDRALVMFFPKVTTDGYGSAVEGAFGHCAK